MVDACLKQFLTMHWWEHKIGVPMSSAMSIDKNLNEIDKINLELPAKSKGSYWRLSFSKETFRKKRHVSIVLTPMSSHGADTVLCT